MPMAHEFDESDPRFQVRVLAMRLDTVVREKEQIERELHHQKEELEQELHEEEEERKKLEKRIAAMERAFQRGAGIAIALPILGTVFGVLLAYGKVIFAPWMGGSR